MLADVQVQGPTPVFFWFFFLFVMAMAIGGLALWIWALVDCIRVPDDRYYRAGTKLIWVLVIVLLQVIGAIVYLVAGRPEKGVRAGWTAPTGSNSMPPPPPPLRS